MKLHPHVCKECGLIFSTSHKEGEFHNRQCAAVFNARVREGRYPKRIQHKAGRRYNSRGLYAAS